jgi:hypothetical protein
MIFDWNEDKCQTLKKERNIGFENIVLAIEEDHLLDVLDHPNKARYKNQYLLIVEINEYVYIVPAVRDKDIWFLKTIYPSRKYTDLYLPGKRRSKK